MNFDHHRLLDRPIPDQDHEETAAAAYVHRILGDDCADVLDMLGIGGRP